MNTHEWNLLDTRDVVNTPRLGQCGLWPDVARENRTPAIAASLAAGDGVYALGDLRDELEGSPLSEEANEVLASLYDGDGRYGLADLRRALRTFTGAGA